MERRTHQARDRDVATTPAPAMTRDVRSQRWASTRAATLVLASSLAFGCAATTTYGRSPKPLPAPDSFRFRVFFNQYTTPEETDRSAREEADEFRVENSYAGFEIVGSRCTYAWVAYCDYEIAFRR